MRNRFVRGFATEAPIALSVLLVAALLGGIVIFDAERHVTALLDWLDEHDFWGPFVFAVVYMVVVILLVPGFLFTLGAGFLFGVVKGSFLIIVAETLGATVAFLIARRFLGARLSRFMTGHPRFGIVSEGFSREGWKVVLLTRLVPFFPFKLSNYYFGMSRYSLRGFVLGTMFGIIPLTLANVYIGSLAADLATLGERSEARSNTEWAMHGAGLVIAVASAVYLARRTRRALADREQGE